jgi:peptidoglycan/LPS O-acetylase OafA/YrhL
MIATSLLVKRRLLERQTTRADVVHSATLAIACLINYWLITHILVHSHSVSRSDNLLGGMWAVIATVVVYRSSYQQSVTAALSRTAATSLSFALCLIYLLILPFNPWGLALLIGIGTLVLMLIGRPDDIVTTAITTAVVMVVAALSPRRVGTADPARIRHCRRDRVGLAASWTGLRLTVRHQR